MSTTQQRCKYCNIPENKQERPGLVCEACACFVHLECLRRPGTPGDFACDVFFEFTCEDCSETKKELFVRNKFPWVNVILLTLHHLSTQSQGISNNGFFHYKTHICSFIDRSWRLLFGAQTKQKKNWVGTIAGVLSVYNNYVFRSGSMILGETGWWKLLHGLSPAVAADIIQELAREKPKGRPRNQLSLDKVLFTQKVTEMGYQHLINNEEDSLSPTVDSTPAKKRRLECDTMSSASVSFYDQVDSDGRLEPEDSYLEARVARSGSCSDAESVFRGFDFATHAPPFHSDSSSINSQPVLYYDSDSRDGSTQPEPNSDDGDKKTVEKAKKQHEDKPYVKRESLFSTELNSVDLPWVEKEPENSTNLVEMSQYEEIQLLKQVEGLIPKVKDPNKKAYLCRLKAKLALRRLKRHKHLPIFDLDKAVRLLGGYMTEDPRIVMNGERVLDRFQRSYLIDSLCGTIASTNYGTLLVPRIEPAPFRSAHSGAQLRPYIRRDATLRPPALKLRDELLRRTHRHIPGYTPPPPAPLDYSYVRPQHIAAVNSLCAQFFWPGIDFRLDRHIPGYSPLDYSYVRPQHIAAVNSLCAQFFWPGIDLTEALQYPEHSCVVTYGRLVVACAFLVPGAGYVSFVVVRPQWRGVGIASFMLYHLLQTCSGTDVTLHVSPTNPAIFLYQKFGFKVEELVQDFYEKYYDIDYKGCRHALFLRLIR